MWNYAYHKRNYIKMTQNLKDKHWDNKLENISSEDLWHFFQDIFNQEMKGNIPKTYLNKQAERKFKINIIYGKDFVKLNVEETMKNIKIKEIV